MGFESFLSREYERRRDRNRRYSLRAYARDLGCDHATLSQWIRGARPISDQSIGAICTVLGLDEATRERVSALEDVDVEIAETVRAAAHCTSPAIAAKLGIPGDLVNIALGRLIRLGLLRMDGPRWSIAARELFR